MKGGGQKVVGSKNFWVLEKGRGSIESGLRKRLRRNSTSIDIRRGRI